MFLCAVVAGVYVCLLCFLPCFRVFFGCPFPHLSLLSLYLSVSLSFCAPCFIYLLYVVVHPHAWLLLISACFLSVLVLAAARPVNSVAASPWVGC